MSTGTRIGVAAALALVLAAGRAAGLCAGDCDGGGGVSIDEVVRGVNLALGSGGVACAALDADGNGGITIDELVSAVTGALGGCPIGPVTADAFARNYAALLYANYSDAVVKAQALQSAIDAFLAAPSQATLDAARDAWRAGRPAYLQTEMARFYDGPIDNETTGVEGLVNSWPLDESFIDYVVGQADAGIINHPELYPDITAGVLIGANAVQSETTIATGWHAIEFLLWGQDFDPKGPGNRPFTDYLADGTGTAANQARRAAYLRVVTDLLVANLEQVRDAWTPDGAGNYRAELLTVGRDEVLRRILTGEGTLSGGELTGERMSVAYETKDQEDEHSCFSDNTHIDFRMDEQGLRNLLFGHYGAVRGPGLYDLVRTVDPQLADQTLAAMQAASVAIYAIPVPFDQAILGPDTAPGRVAIAAAIAALNAQTDKIAECAEALGISISTTSP